MSAPDRSRPADRPRPRSGIVVVDKPGGMTSHDVVSRVRRIVGTRKVGHAGTLDPMATGVLIIGVERGTKLLGHLMGHDKTYTATIRLGERTTTDDREGETLDVTSAAHLTEERIRTALASQTGPLAQIPSSVSAKKVDGRRAYDLVREGKQVDLAPREVVVHEIDVHDIRAGDHTDIDVTVRCTAGTYIRAIARDVGDALGVGGHLTALRRTASGSLTEADAIRLEDLADLDEPVVHSLDDVVRRTFPVRQLSDREATDLSYGRRLAPYGDAELYAAVDEGGTAVALIGPSGKPSVVFRPA